MLIIKSLALFSKGAWLGVRNRVGITLQTATKWQYGKMTRDIRRPLV
jgi:hypothetical protein